MKFLILFILFIRTIHALTNIDILQLTEDLNLKAGTKASIQWKRVFSSPRYIKKYKLETLSSDTRRQLKQYLIQHAADSDQPIVPGL